MAVPDPVNEKDTGRSLEGEINVMLVDERLPCPGAFRVSRKLGVPPITVGEKADEMGVRVSNCQLGCFGTAKAAHEELAAMQVSPAIEQGLRGALVEGRIPCEVAHALAGSLKVSRRKVGDTASKLGIKVSACQLGCF